MPNSFRLLMHDLSLLGLIQLKEVEFLSTGGSEFYMTMSRSGPGMDVNRLDVMKVIEVELKGAKYLPVANVSFFERVLRRILGKIKRAFST